MISLSKTGFLSQKKKMYPAKISVGSYASLTQNHLLNTVRSDCKNVGAAPIASIGPEPVRSNIREQIYLEIVWCE